MNNPFESFSVAVVTPFGADGSLTEPPVRAHLERLASLGVRAFLVAGSTGEQHSMSVDERSQLYRWATRGPGSIYAGVAAVRTGDAVTLAKAAEAAGARGIMLGFPPYVRLTAADARVYVRTVTNATGLPILLYNNPLRTAFDLMPDALEAVVDENPTVVAVKETADPSRAKAIRTRLGAHFGIFAGSDRTIADAWEQGYNGLTSVAGNLWPQDMAAVVADLVAGRPEQARAALETLTPALRTVIETQLPASLKHGLRFLGLPGGWCRDPLGHLDPAVVEALESALTARE